MRLKFDENGIDSSIKQKLHTFSDTQYIWYNIK